MKRFALIIVLSAFSAASHAAAVTVVAKGEMFEYFDPDGLLPFDQPTDKAEFTLRFTYDDATADLMPDERLGLYGNAVSAMTLTIGSDTFGLLPSGNSVLIGNDSGQPCDLDCLDYWFTSTQIRTPVGNEGHEIVENFALSLQSWSTLPVPPLTSDALVEPSWPSGWGSGNIYYQIYRDEGDTNEILAIANSNVFSISIVPTPAAVWLFASAIGCLGWMRRKTA